MELSIPSIHLPWLVFHFMDHSTPRGLVVWIKSFFWCWVWCISYLLATELVVLALESKNVSKSFVFRYLKQAMRVPLLLLHSLWVWFNSIQIYSRLIHDSRIDGSLYRPAIFSLGIPKTVINNTLLFACFRGHKPSTSLASQWNFHFSQSLTYIPD